MLKAPILDNDDQRLTSLYELDVLDNPNHNLFDGATELAAHMFGAPIALVSLIDADRQWFAARYNFEAEETPRDISFCGHAITGHDAMVVPDARLDSRFRDNPLVCSKDPVVFYAGAPLVTPDGMALGTLCVIDHEPKYPTERQIKSLERLAKFVLDQMELRRASLREQHRATRAAAEHRERARLLHDGCRDLNTALSGVVAMSRHLEESITDPSLLNTATRLKYSAMGLVDIARLLEIQDPDDPAASTTHAIRVNPLAEVAAATSGFSAELARRKVELSVKPGPGAPSELQSNPRILRLTLFHAMGFIVSSQLDGTLAVAVGGTPTEDAVVFSFTANGNIKPPVDLPSWEVALAIRSVTGKDPARDSLSSLHTLCDLLGASLSIKDDSEQLELNIQVPLFIAGDPSNA